MPTQDSTTRWNVIEVHRRSPLRQPWWRWDLAHELVASCQHLSANRPDPALAAAVDYLHHQRPTGRPGTSDPAHRAVDAALRLHQQDEPVRWELEARLLAGEPTERISWRVGISARVIEMYHDLFFDVRNALEAKDWICGQVLDLGPWASGEPPESVTWAYWGWLGGPLMVDLLTGDYLGRVEPDWPDRAELAAKTRMCLQLHGVAEHDYKAVAQVMRAIRRRFPRLAAEQRKRDPLWRIHLAVIELAAGQAGDCTGGPVRAKPSAPRPARRRRPRRRARSMSAKLYEQR